MAFLFRAGMIASSSATTSNLFPIQQQIENCAACPFLYRLAESCPKYPELFNKTPPDAFTESDLVFPMNEVSSPTFRDSLLLELRTTELFLLNMQLYCMWICEIVMVSVSTMAWAIPYATFAVYFITRKPEVCRLCNVILCLKLMSAFIINQFELLGYQPVYRCGLDGQIQENRSLDEPIIILSGFFTYLALQTSLTLSNHTANSKDEEIFDSKHYGMIAVGTFIILNYCAKLHLILGSEASIMTSFEIGMMLTIMIKVTMNILGFWPSRYLDYVEASLNEEILLAHICAKWNIDNKLPKLEKLSTIVTTLSGALTAKKEFDKQAEELASKTQEDVHVYKQLLKDANWKEMKILVDEVLNQESKICYLKLKEEINQLRKKDDLNIRVTRDTYGEDESKKPKLSLPQDQIKKLKLQLPPFKAPSPTNEQLQQLGSELYTPAEKTLTKRQ